MTIRGRAWDRPPSEGLDPNLQAYLEDLHEDVYGVGIGGQGRLNAYNLGIEGTAATTPSGRAPLLAANRTTGALTDTSAGVPVGDVETAFGEDNFVMGGSTGYGVTRTGAQASPFIDHRTTLNYQGNEHFPAEDDFAVDPDTGELTYVPGDVTPENVALGAQLAEKTWSAKRIVDYVNGSAFDLAGDVTGPKTATEIAPKVVTRAKMADMGSTARLVGSSSAAVDAAEITVGAGLVMTGTTLTASGGVPGAHTHDWADITGEPTTLAGYGINDAAGILAQLLTVDGAASGLDADTLDGMSSAAFAAAAHAHSAADITSGTLDNARLDSDLASWAAITRASGFDTFVATPSSANLAALLTDEASSDIWTQYALLAGRAGGQTLIGGTGTTDALILRVTSGVGTTGADMIFQGGNNGATEFARFLNSGNFGIGIAAPTAILHVFGSGATLQRNSATNPTVGLRLRNDDTTTPNGTSVDWQFADSGGTVRNVIGLVGRATARGASSVTTELGFGVASAATIYTEVLKLTPTALNPATAKGLTLGTTTLGFGPAYFADNAAQPTPGSNQAALYAYDSGGGTTELWAADEAGNDTQLSAHHDVDTAVAAGVVIDPSDPFPRVGYDRNVYIGKEAYTYTSPTTGLTQRVVRDLAPEKIRDWDADQTARIAAAEKQHAEWRAAKDAHEKDESADKEPFTDPEPVVPARKEPPKWVKDRIPKETHT